MAVYPAAGAFLLVWLLLNNRNAENGVPMVIAVLPFGMFAAVAFGGLSLILANFLAMLTTLVLCIRFFSNRGLSHSLRLPSAGGYLVVYALYSLFSAIVLVRIFQGQFLVFPMNVTFQSTQVSVFFPSTMVPLWPTKSNISQSFYILLSAGFFIAAVQVFRQRSLRFAETGLVWAASINCLLGFFDFLQLDEVLNVVRTADYALANQHTVAGFERIVGGYSEASIFGASSAGLAGYFMMSYLIGYHTRDGLLALGNLACAAMALSSTAFLAICTSVVIILLHSWVFIDRNLSRKAGHVLVIATASSVAVICLLIMFTSAAELASDLLDRLVFSKRGSLSGLERAAWAQAGTEAFFQTWGLGAGAGSLRASGLLPVLLGSVGLPGALAFLGFMLHSVGKPMKSKNREARRVFYASRVSALTLLSSMLVSATSPDPTLLLMAVTAVAVATREKEAVKIDRQFSQTESSFIPDRLP